MGNTIFYPLEQSMIGVTVSNEPFGYFEDPPDSAQIHTISERGEP
jgi:hypothetical protein